MTGSLPLFAVQSSNSKAAPQSRRRPGPPEKHCKAKENGTDRSNGTRHSTSDHDEDSSSEKEEDSRVSKETPEKQSSHLQNGTADENEATEQVNGSAEPEEKPFAGDVTPGDKENREEETREENGVAEGEKAGALQNGIHDSSEEKREKEETSEASPSLAMRTRAKKAEGKPTSSCVRI